MNRQLELIEQCKRVYPERSHTKDDLHLAREPMLLARLFWHGMQVLAKKKEWEWIKVTSDTKLCC